MTTEVNYTSAQVKELLDAVPVDLDTAKMLAEKQGRGKNGYRSVISKLKRLENDESISGDRPFYIAKPAYQPKAGGEVEKKADIVSQVSNMLGEVEITSLVKASKADLVRLRTAIISLEKAN